MEVSLLVATIDCCAYCQAILFIVLLELLSSWRQRHYNPSFDAIKDELYLFASIELFLLGNYATIGEHLPSQDRIIR